MKVPINKFIEVTYADMEKFELIDLVGDDKENLESYLTEEIKSRFDTYYEPYERMEYDLFLADLLTGDKWLITNKDPFLVNAIVYLVEGDKVIVKDEECFPLFFVPNEKHEAAKRAMIEGTFLANKHLREEGEE